MQNTTVMALRKRAKSRGYREIRIKLIGDGLYHVSAIDPLTGMTVQCDMDIVDMVNRLR